MDDGFDLKAFLDQQRQEGVHEDEGVFTIARDKLLTKVAKFSLPGTDDWVLKIVQAANVWRAPRLVVRQTRLATSFFLCPPDKSFPTEARLIQNLSAGILDGEQPIAMLCMAMRSLVDQVGLSFVLAIRHKGFVCKPIFAGDDTTALTPEVREKWASMSKDGIRLTVSHFRGSESSKGRYIPTFSGVPRRDTAIAKVLESFAYSSEVPILFDGRLLSNPPQHPDVGNTTLGRVLRLNFLIPQDQPEAPTPLSSLRASSHEKPEKPEVLLGDIDFSPFTPRSQLQVEALHHRSNTPWYLFRTLEWRRLGEVFGTDLATPPARRLESEHKIYWVRNGVVVKRQALRNRSLGSSVAVFLPAANLRSDLTGLSIDIDEAANSQAGAALRATAESLRKFRCRLVDYLDENLSAPSCSGKMAMPSSEISEAGFSIFTESLATPILKAFRRMPATVEALTRVGFVNGERVRFFAKWWLILPDEIDKVIEDLQSGSDARGAGYPSRAIAPGTLSPSG